MAGWLELDTIAPGTPVFDADDMPLGTVEAVEGQTLRIGGRLLPGAAVARVDPAGIFLHPEGAWEGADTGGGGAAPIAASGPDGGAAIDPTVGGPAGSASTPRIVAREEGRIVIPLAEERLVVTHRTIDLGEIIIIKRVIEEERTVPVIVRREIVERVTRAADGTETIEELSARVFDAPASDMTQQGRTSNDRNQ